MARLRWWIGFLLAFLVKMSVMLIGWAAVGTCLGWALERQDVLTVRDGALLGAMTGLLIGLVDLLPRLFYAFGDARQTPSR